MKPHLQKISLYHDHSFSVKHEICPRMYNQWHYHPEVELIYIVQGSGTVFIGDSLRPFAEGSIFMIGSNVPHLMRSDIQYYDERLGLISEAIVIHFLPEALGVRFLDLPENKAIAGLLEESSHGLELVGGGNEQVQQLMNRIRFSRGCSRLIDLLQILNVMSGTSELNVISEHPFRHSFNGVDENRLNRIYQYTLNNFLREITLKEIADIVHMTPHSFCRYFKSRTNKRYSTFLMEIRISHACKLLLETEDSIAVICYESGFTNCSNFNRHFKHITGHTPLEYRKLFKKSIHPRAMPAVGHSELYRTVADTNLYR